MASTNSWIHEIESSVSASRLLCVGVMDWHTLYPKLVPQIVSALPIEGEGGISSVMQFNFTSAMPFNLMKERLDFIDVDNCQCKSTLIEGGGIGTAIETATSQIKVEPTANGGSIANVESTYKLLPGVEVNDEISEAKDSVTDIFKAAEAYLIANPDAYN
ncbi:hypothetical protein ZWY2020_049985 [Hordeum vulgare]|nr:hypothetical protein ZWY2020_049985 [Hordeum vulgare]